MPKAKILVVEDDSNIQELVKYNLEEAGYQVLTASRGDTGLDRVRKERPDLLLLDLMLPEMDGIEMTKVLKQNDKTSHIPIIMLTAKAQEADRVLGLELGADDYVAKPFSPRELVARVKAVLRRRNEKPKHKLLKSGALEMDTERHVVTSKGKVVPLTSKEYDLLQSLLEADGRVRTREFLLEHIWGYDQSLHIETRTVDMHVGQLRKKLKSEAERLVTVKNVGYRLDPVQS